MKPFRYINRRLQNFVLLVTTAGGMLFSPLSHGLIIAEHKKIVLEAAEAFETCFPLDPITQSKHLEWIASGNVGEDTNILRKWTQFSHYYHPHRRIRMFRRDSLSRVNDLARKIRIAVWKEWFLQKFNWSKEARATRRFNFFQKTYKQLGGLTHHIQDMSSPSHVIPVKHFLKDGFETAYKDFRQNRPEVHLDCNRLKRKEPDEVRPNYLLKKHALGTLMVTRAPLEIQKNGEILWSDWSLFWKESSRNSFGYYGTFGNKFGKTEIWSGSDQFLIEEEKYLVYRNGRIKDAILGTVELYYWFKKLTEKYGL